MNSRRKTNSKDVEAAARNSGGRGRAASDPNLEQFAAFVTSDLEREVLDSMSAVFEDLGESIASVISARVRHMEPPTTSSKEGLTGRSDEGWIGIESLSRLRSVVGGRFQNIKKKWIDAGFPLREHRGDRWREFELVEAGWLDLSTWIAKQGFEARLTRESKDFLFELRPFAGG